MLKFCDLIYDQKVIYPKKRPENPEISVIMPTYEKGDSTLKKAVESVLNQSFENFELIIVDDGSRDDTVEILKDYQRQDNRITLIGHEYNSGLPAVRINEGIMISRGKFVAYQFDDQEWLPNCLSELYRVISLNKDLHMVYGTAKVFIEGDNGKVKETNLGEPYSYAALLSGNFIAHNAVLHRKSLFDQCGLFDPHVLLRKDSAYDLWRRFGERVSAVWVDRQVSRIRRRRGKDRGGEQDRLWTYIRRFLEIPRNERLKAANIHGYRVDEMISFQRYFSCEEVDELNRACLIPYRHTVPYYFSDRDLPLVSISRTKKKRMLICGDSMLLSSDELQKRIKGENFPYQVLITDSAGLEKVKPRDFDICVLPRNAQRNPGSLAEKLHESGKAFVYEPDGDSPERKISKLLCAAEAAELKHRLEGKRLAYFFHDINLTGATLHLFKHALFAKELGFDVLLCIHEGSGRKGDLVESAKRHNMPLHYLSYGYYTVLCHPSPEDMQSSKAIARWLLDNRIGLVHSVTLIPAVGLACRILGIPHLTTIHQFDGSKMMKEIARNLKWCDAVHSSSVVYASVWSDWLGVKSRKICCPVDEGYFRLFDGNIRRERSSFHKPVILVSGTLQERKNQLGAIQAMGLLKKWGIDAQLVMIGYEHLRPDYSERCRREIQKLAMESSIVMKGFVKRPGQLYKGYADVLLCASSDESMPQTILKAMASGVLVVTTPVGGIPEVIKDRYTGIIIEEPSPLSIARALSKAILLPHEERKKMLQNAHLAARMICEPSFVKAELINLYNETFESCQERFAKANMIRKALAGEMAKGRGLIVYRSYVEGIGWQDWAEEGAVSGTAGRSLRMEAFCLQWKRAIEGLIIRYRVHIQDIGWQDWVYEGGIAGAPGKLKRVEAICIQLEDPPPEVHIQYQVHVQDLGWLPWVQDGEIAGTVGRSLRLEAIRVRISIENPWEAL